MSITITIVADTADEALFHARSLTPAEEKKTTLSEFSLDELVAYVTERLAGQGFTLKVESAPEPVAEPQEAPPPAKKGKTKAVPKKAPSEPEEDAEAEAVEKAAKQINHDETKALLELKEKCVKALQAAFANGQADKVRTILKKHNARNFNTIAIEEFPKIEITMKELGIGHD